MSVLDLLGDAVGGITAAVNGGNSTKAANNAATAVNNGLSNGISTLNNGRDAALAYLQPTQQLGITAGQTLGNAYGLNGAAPAGSQAGLTRADPYNIGAPTAPAQAAFSFDPSSVSAASDPGMAYARQQALDSVGQGAFAVGKGLSGAAVKATQTTAGNIANQYFQQAYGRDLGLATQNYAQDTAYNNTNYGQNYTAATDAYARQNTQFQNYLTGVTGLNTAGNTAANQAAGVQTGISTTGANLDANAAANTANIITGKALAQNGANTALGSNISSAISSYGSSPQGQSLLNYLGLGSSAGGSGGLQPSDILSMAGLG